MSKGWLDHVKATKGWLHVDQAKLLYEAAGRVRHGCIVEVGSYRGRSTVALAAGAPQGIPVFAVEPHEEFVGAGGGEFGPEDRRGFFRAMLRSGAYRNVRLINLSSEVVAPGWRVPVALLWIDGDHRYEAVRRDVDAWMPHLTDDAELVFDDSMNPKLGPMQVIDELLATGAWTVAERSGKVRLLRRTPSQERS